MRESLISRLRDEPDTLGAFALLVRANRGAAPTLEVLCGEISEYQHLETIPLPPEHHLGPWELSLIPYRQICERGYTCKDDHEPLRSLRVLETEEVELHSALVNWPDTPIAISSGEFDLSDGTYATLVNNIIKDEISKGEGSNFVIKRTYQAKIRDYSLASALSAFKRLVLQETGAYWIFLVHTGERTWIGASPEKHISLREGIATMNPISGTYRYPKNGATLPGVLEFLRDKKEADELYMVVDEELKMMASVCRDGVQVKGPNLKLMSRLAHTEYVLEGPSDTDPRTILKKTMLSPAVTGSPIQNACRVIAKYEPYGRHYYAGVLALIGRDKTQSLSLDSTILIRTADIDRTGHLKIPVGATIVRHSNPTDEALETRAKALAIINAFGQPVVQGLANAPAIMSALEQRNTEISEFWLADFKTRSRQIEKLASRELLIIDADDNFTEMLRHQICSLGLKVVIAHANDLQVLKGYRDLALFGPGPGDPNSQTDLRINNIRQALRDALDHSQPFIAVCLSHQLLCAELGLTLTRLDPPNQGLQREIDYFGKTEKVGFYNTFCARCEKSKISYREQFIEVSRDLHSHEVHALRGPHFISVQFHPESILTQQGPSLLDRALLHIAGEQHPSQANA